MHIFPTAVTYVVLFTCTDEVQEVVSLLFVGSTLPREHFCTANLQKQQNWLVGDTQLMATVNRVTQIFILLVVAACIVSLKGFAIK
jgi:hypothetical protein